MALNKVNIEFTKQQMEKVLEDIEKLKDKIEKNGNIQIFTMIETVVALLMFVNNEIKEHRIQESMSDCLKGKRLAERTYIKTIVCILSMYKSKAELESNIDGSKSIKKLILE